MKNSSRQRLVLKRGKEASLERRHPWIFSGALKENREGPVEDGAMVDVYSHKGDYIGMGHYQSGASIAVRMLSYRPIDEMKLWQEKIKKAWEYRKRIGIADNKDINVYRLIFSEGDGLSGLIVDYYNGVAVLQAHTIGMFKSRFAVSEILKDVLGDRLTAVYDKSKEALHGQTESVDNGFILGSAGDFTEVNENGKRFIVNWATGQKTGFFIDQRENRKMVGSCSKGKCVLNTFCYTGGFSVYAGCEGAAMVHSVDSSKKAMETAEENMRLNNISNHELFTDDVFNYLKSCDEYDLIVLDPPAFAKRIKARHKAVMGYKRLNAAAMRKISKGGMLFTFSCSQAVDKRLFQDTVIAAAIEANRYIRIMGWLSQPKDHPVNIFHPEGEYLKGLALYIE